MNFQDSGIIIAKRPLQEKSSIISVFTKHHGLYSGVVNQYSKKSGDSIVPGNVVDFFWQARLHEHIGLAKCELIKAYHHHIIASKTRLYAFNSIVEIIQKAFCEREAHNNLFPHLLGYLQNMSQQFNFIDYINLELAILAETGHGLSLDACVVSGATDNLCYVSPKSGCAVSLESGKEYHDKLLKLPAFMSRKYGSMEHIEREEKKAALDLINYFFSRYISNQTRHLTARKILTEHLLH